jgi:tRNA threonylcarbamoyladenosine biosynthesis protein TsaB
VTPRGPRILAVDTGSEFGGLALTESGSLVEEKLIHAPDGFGHVLFGELERLLARHNLRVNDIDCFAAAAGPGSFTGVRVALSTVKGLAETAGRPAVAVSSLQALAWHGAGALRSAILDARRGEIFGGLYDAELRAVAPERAAPLSVWLAGLPPGEIEWIWPESHSWGSEVPPGKRTTAPNCFARAVASIAAARFAAGEAQDPAALDANYVRRSDAELKWKDS